MRSARTQLATSAIGRRWVTTHLASGSPDCRCRLKGGVQRPRPSQALRGRGAEPFCRSKCVVLCSRLLLSHAGRVWTVVLKRRDDSIYVIGHLHALVIRLVQIYFGGWNRFFPLSRTRGSSDRSALS